MKLHSSGGVGVVAPTHSGCPTPRDPQTRQWSRRRRMRSCGSLAPGSARGESPKVGRRPRGKNSSARRVCREGAATYRSCPRAAPRGAPGLCVYAGDERVPDSTSSPRSVEAACGGGSQGAGTVPLCGVGRQIKALSAKQEAQAAKQEAQAAKQEDQAAKQEAQAAKQEAQAAKQEAQAAKQEAQAAKQEAQAAKQEAQAAKQEAQAAKREAQAAKQEAHLSGLEEPPAAHPRPRARAPVAAAALRYARLR
ncbi:translation initiation factor IF-2-like [Schistocerca nitens]|uniref:translation initiation factor IF-2-like n=1 Tax=Schistocerca nitens TaxID=7011 RepID=UPI0021187598|nr:translation initiation factor IF-2-like [Schistocerca nitens]